MMILICGSYPGLSHYFNFIFLKENKNPPIAFSGPGGIVSLYIILESFFWQSQNSSPKAQSLLWRSWEDWIWRSFLYIFKWCVKYQACFLGTPRAELGMVGSISSETDIPWMGELSEVRNEQGRNGCLQRCWTLAHHQRASSMGRMNMSK